MYLRLLKEEELELFIKGIQASFQQGFERYFGKCEQTVIPKEDFIGDAGEGMFEFEKRVK